MHLLDLSPACVRIGFRTNVTCCDEVARPGGCCTRSESVQPAGPSWAHPLVPQVRGVVSRPLRLAPVHSTLPGGTSRPVPRAATLTLFIKGQQPH